MIGLDMFMVNVGVSLEISFHTLVAVVFWMLGMIAFMRGVLLYEDEAKAELEQKMKKPPKTRIEQAFM